MNTRYVYSSTQVNLPQILSSQIMHWSEEYIPDNTLFNDPTDMTFGREDESHVTILYGLHSENSYGIRKILTDVNSFKIELGKISLFTWSDKFDVVKIEVISEELFRLNRLFSRLQCTQTFPAYKPHVTIAFVKKDTANHLVNNSIFAGIVFEAKEVVFSSKHGIKTIIPLVFCKKSTNSLITTSS